MIRPPFESIQTDFKLINLGDWFVPVTLKDVDQYDLLPQAIEKKISGFVCEADKVAKYKDLGVPHVIVSNLREFLFQEARNKRDLLNLDIITVSGSNGKTTVKELIGAVLKQAYSDLAFMSPENQNTKVALANQILRLSSTCRTAVFEVGARRKGDFQIPLTYLKPRVSVLLNIGTAHIGEFGSQEILTEEKLSVLKNVWAQTLVVPFEDSLILKTAKQTGKRVTTFGYDPQSDVQIISSRPNEVTLKHLDETHTIKCAGTIAAFELNCAAAVACALTVSIPWSTIKSALQDFGGVRRRFYKFQWNSQIAIDDAFNSSPESMRLGLRTLKHQFPQAKPLLVLGSMLELGNISEQEHRKLAHEILKLYPEKNFDLIAVGEDIKPLINEFRTLDSKLEFRHFGDSKTAKSYVTQRKNEFDVIYFKGSKSIQLQQIWENS